VAPRRRESEATDFVGGALCTRRIGRVCKQPQCLEDAWYVRALLQVSCHARAEWRRALSGPSPPVSADLSHNQITNISELVGKLETNDSLISLSLSYNGEAPPLASLQNVIAEATV
jgi:hypothetical protein